MAQGFTQLMLNDWWRIVGFHGAMAGWWFGTCFIFPYIGNNHPNWRTHIFQRGWNHQPDDVEWSLTMVLSTGKSAASQLVHIGHYLAIGSHVLRVEEVWPRQLQCATGSQSEFCRGCPGVTGCFNMVGKWSAIMVGSTSFCMSRGYLYHVLW